MKKMRRITALFLCILMMFPAQAMTILADTEENLAVESTEKAAETETIEEETEATERIEETLEVEMLESEQERIDETLEVEALPSDERIEETLPVEPLTVWNEEAMIYWNPGGELPAELASASNLKASASNAKKGRDSADGMSPERPVLTLARALEQAEKLQEELGVESSEITIYAMNPMEIADGQLYVLNGADIRIASWPGRSYDNDTIFYVNGGQLSLVNTLLESGNQEDEPEKIQLITVHGGTLQLGQAVEINGQIAMDYRKIKEDGLWEVASASNTATRSNAGQYSEDGETTSFNIDEYILSTDEQTAELIEDSTTASTWCKPIIELMEGYEDNSGEYLLAVNTDNSSSQIELVRTLCADELTSEEFLDYFTITYNDETGAEWNLTAETTEEATIRDTASADTALYRSFEQLLTEALDDEGVSASAVMSDETTSVTVASTKSLIATRAGSSTVKYWNPGGELTVSGQTYPAGADNGVDGNDPRAAYKTWDKAVANANGGTIICMQSVTLGPGAEEYIGNPQADGSYLIQSSARETMVTLKVWNSQPQPAFIVPSGETFVLKNIELSGIDKDGVAASTQTVLCQSGDIVIEENVTAETGFIQVDAFSGLADHPVTVNSINASDDGIITLFFGGINDNLSYRFTDVVVPGSALDAEVSADPDRVGKELLARVVLDTANRDAAHGGQSNFDWSLRQDTDQDGDPLDVNPQNLELYTEYYYDAIYLDGERGLDSNYGATCQFPVKTWGRAYQLWTDEMARSIAARARADAEGQSTDYIEANFPLPTVIYICGTVKLDAASTAADRYWKLEPKTDYNGTILSTEVRSHVDIPYDDNGNPVHDLPDILVKVDSGGLTIEDVTIRNYTDEKDSITLQVNGGSKLTLTGSTLLTGERLESVDTLTPYQEVTYGTHVQVTAGGTFIMDAGWDGAIERREHGVEGTGVGASITMNAGEIRENNSFDQALFEANQTSHLNGAGVVLSNAASFEMNGGKITKNTVYQYGAGVYLTGTGTSFTMNKGEISYNQMAGYERYYNSGTVQGYGIGIYAGTGTVVNLGSSTSTKTTALVTQNMGYFADGIGVWTNGTLNVINAAITDNYNSDGGSYTTARKGLGIYAGTSAKLTMDGVDVTGNHSSTTTSRYDGNAQGAGIYLAYNTNGNEIKNSNIIGNSVGCEDYYSSSSSTILPSKTYSSGGGIYLAGGKLDIKNCVIENNEAFSGAGIMVYQTSNSYPVTLTVSATSISNNKARCYRFPEEAYGEGGGIYAEAYGTIDLTGSQINNNTSNNIGGGMYLNNVSGSTNTNRLNLTMEDVKINQNQSYSSGAGIYVQKCIAITANNYTEFVDNESISGNGGAIYAYGGDSSYATYYASRLDFTNVNIELNKAKAGAGIYSNYYTYMYFNDVDIINNTATSDSGGGIYGYRNTFMYFNDVDIEDNEALSGSGGGIYVDYYNDMYFNKVNIINNNAKTNGGGIYSNYYTKARFLEVNIKQNTAGGNGGGCYFYNYGSPSTYIYYLTDTRIENNNAGNMGGGIYYYSSYSSSNMSLYFLESAPGNSSLTGNSANSGGGLYSSGYAAVHLDIDGEFQNEAEEKGSNLYLCNAINYIYTGKFLQPSEPKSEVYNIYLDAQYSSTRSFIMDPQKVVIEKKAGSEPDAIYLNTTNSFLSFLTKPLTNYFGELPIDVNTNVFKEGSIVVKPANLGDQTLSLVTIGSDNYATSLNSYTNYYNTLDDVTDYAEYCSGGILPRRTQLGGYNFNIVIVGEGIYLDGIKGRDSNDGSAPDQAVKTFDVAKQKLEERILLTEQSDAGKTDPEGYSPFIYICGNVIISGTETWELDYEDDLFLVNNLNYRTKEAANAYDAQIRRFASFVDDPMISVGETDTDVAELTTGKIIINGMADAVISADQGSQSPVIEVKNKSKATLTGNSRITNNYYSGIDVYGTLVLSGDEFDENKQLLNHHGSYVRMMASDASLEMNGYSRIVSEGKVTRIGSTDLNGIYISAANVKNVVMKENSNISTLSTSDGTGTILLSYGIYISGQNSEVRMQDSSEISTNTYGIYVNGSYATISMEDFAKISNSSYGVYLYSGGNNSTILMNRNTEANNGDSACITGSGISSYYAYGTKIEMGKNAQIKRESGTRSGYGIYFRYPYTTTTDTESSITMFDNSRITNYSYGFYFDISGDYPIKIVMKDNAAVDQNSYGMYEYSSTGSAYNDGINRLELVMEGNSRISGNYNYGICLIGNKGFSSTSYHKISMTDNAVIGGPTAYSSNDATSGNRYTGIYANSPINLEMSGSSQISGNGYSTSASSYTTANAITLIPQKYPTTQSDLRATETAYITLRENASICNNNGGIYIDNETSYPLNPCEITLDGSSGSPSIQGNTDAVYLKGTDQKIKLEGTAILGASTTTSNGEALALDCYGSVELDGRSQINGLTYLHTATQPITMTHTVDDPSRDYRLYLVEGFLGRIVVQPDDPDGLKGGLTDVTGQLGYFTKVGAEGMAAGKVLAAAAPNIILQGENNVYLSGSSFADDDNNGSSPSTPVKTFKRAKALLEGEGYYTSGANIIICTSAVSVLSGDEDWSFDSDGKVTNSQSGESWKPVVIRYEGYTSGRLIQVSSSTGYADTVTFKNITIDGGSEEGTIVTGYSAPEVLFVGLGRTAILGEGAVLQNNTVDASYITAQSSAGVRVYGGTLKIQGGVIQNMVRTSTNTSSTTYTLGAAIYCHSQGSTYPGTVTMTSGEIINNTIKMDSKQGGLRAGAVSVENITSTYHSAVFEMSGGRIENNQVSTKSGYTTTYGAGLVSYNANSTISGGFIRGNAGVQGSAIYYYDTSGTGSMILSGGQITGNTTNEAGKILEGEGNYSPVYVAGWNFQINGGGADIKNNIYLNSTENIVKVSGNIYQTGRVYNLFLNQAASESDTTKFQKGSAVVQPDGSWITDATPYLSYFQVHSNPYVLDAGKTSRTTGTVTGVKENQCLILMHAVFLDSEKGKDTNNGTNPDLAVETFAGAQAVGRAGIGSSDVSEYYVIYISGKATNKTDTDGTWTLPEPAYMCRYTGFMIYNADGSENKAFPAYYGYLIEPSYDLILDGVTVYGRRSIDTVDKNGESLVNVKAGINVTVQKTGTASTIFGRNNNQGEYTNPEDGGYENLSTKGGAFYVQADGNLYMLGGIISDTNAAWGSAIYLDADAVDDTKFGHLYLKGSPSIAGAVYLAGTGSTTAAFVEPDASYSPATALDIVIGNDYDGRWVVQYPTGTIPGYTEKDYFNLEDSIKALYDVVTDGTVLKLQIRSYLYLDGQSGDDDNDGKTPDTAVKTIEKVYQTIAEGSAVEGTLVFIVDTVEFSSATPKVTLGNILIRNPDGTSSYQGWYEDDNGTSINISGQVYFKRYAQPSGYDNTDPDYTGYSKPTLMNTLFRIESGGDLTLNGIYLDGHSQASDGADKLLVAAGVEAKSPLVTVMNGGILTCSMTDKTKFANGVDTATVFTNNVNANKKDNVIGIIGTPGTDNESKITEGSSAGIELLGGGGGDPANPLVGSAYGGQAFLTRTQFSNLSLGSEVVGGTDVYSFGDLHFSDLTFFSGTVFLEGFGTPATKTGYETSHYLTVDLYGQPAQADFQVRMRDPYNGRTVVYYKPKGDGPDSSQSGRFRLEERVKEFFYLTKRDGVPYVFELQVPAAVYIDGINGVDDTDDRVAGSNPGNPVKTLARAFELLSTRSGHTIYVVGPIQIKPEMGDIVVTGTTYTGKSGTITLGSTDKVKITRYVKPDFAIADNNEAIATGYDVSDYLGELLNVQDGATASFGTNVYFDGHSNSKLGEEYPLEARVTNGAKAKAPLITVAEGGTLNLYSGVTLLDNNNTYDLAADAALKADGIDKDIHYGDGGVLYNSGTTVIDGALFDNNQAAFGSGVYQDGTFTIKSEPVNLKGHTFYLTTENTGTESDPVWGTDHIIQTYVAMPDDLTYDIDMDHAVKGRDVVKFLDPTAYNPDVDAEHDHFVLGSTVPNYLFLVQAVNDETVLELQNWEVLDVNVPSDIYLVIHRSGSLDTTTKLSSVQTEAAGTDLLTSPEYTIKNNGRYDVKVSVIAFENQNDAVGLGHDKMTLVDAPANVLGETDLYLGIQGTDSGSGLMMAETSLQPYAESTVTAAPAELGILNSGTSGGFKFSGAAGTGFIEKYNDSTFPVNGETREDVQKYMNGTSASGIINARAKYAMKFKLEIDPSRLYGTAGSTANP